MSRAKGKGNRPPPVVTEKGLAALGIRRPEQCHCGMFFDEDGVCPRAAEGSPVIVPPPRFACEPCQDKGWLHMGAQDLPPDEDDHIERCDDCKAFATDDDAQDQHRKDCSCGLKVRRARR